MVWIFSPHNWRTPGLATLVRLRPEVTVEATPTGDVVVGHCWGAVHLTGAGRRTIAMLSHLTNQWVNALELSPLRQEFASDGPLAAIASLGELLWTCQKLAFLIEIRVVLADQPLITVQPISRSSALPAEVKLPTTTRLSRFAFLQRHDEDLVLASAVSAHRIVLHGDWSLLLIGGLSRPDYAVPDNEAAKLALSLLGGVGMLEGTETISGAYGSELLAMAEFPDLLLHQRSRFGRHDGGFGAEFPFLNSIPSRPAIPAPLSTEQFPLPRPSESKVRHRDLTLTQAIERRSSLRRYSDRALTLSQLGEFLFRCARTRGQYGPIPAADLPYQASDKPFPSGGGVHDLELYPIVTSVQDLAPGAYHYAADRHTLEPLTAPVGELGAMLRAAARASAAPDLPPVLIAIASRFDRMAWKYRSISYSITLKNVGALYQTMYLVATSMGLAACALGSGDDVAGANALGLATRSELSVGEFMIGNPARPGAAESNAVHRRAHPSWRSLVEPDWGVCT
jgi:SagB-type dehydrogenase family enzyme